MPAIERMSLVFRRYFFATLGALCAIILVYALYCLRSVALMVAIAGLLCYLFAWPINWMSRKLPRWLAITITMIVGVALLAGCFISIIPLVVKQSQELIASLPEMMTNLEHQAQHWRISIIPGHEIEVVPYLNDLGASLQERAPDFLTNAINYSQWLVTSTVAALAALILIPMMMLYFLADSRKLRAAVIGVLPTKARPDADRALTAVNHSLGGYILSRTLLALFIGISSTIAMLVLGVPYAVLLGLFMFLGEFIPVIGPWVAFIPVLVVVLAFEPSVLLILPLLFIGIQLIENYLIAPKLIGDTMDLHPLTVLLAMMIGGVLGGVAGLFVAIPAAAALKVLLNIFVLRREEPGIEVPQLDLIDAEVKAGE
jgi:predicted PurR-regulated permease PerM